MICCDNNKLENIFEKNNKKDIETINSINYTHYNTEPNTNINSFNTFTNYNNENLNYINNNNDYLENIESEKENKIENLDKSGIDDSLKTDDKPTNIDEIIKNEMSSAIIDSFLNQHQIKSISLFILYLSEIWQELSKEVNSIQNQNMGINLFAFNKYYNLPGLIGQRLFNIFDKDNNGFLSPNEFITGMCILFCEEINSLIQFIFNFYDFDGDEKITSDDIHAVLSYLPIINGFDDMIDIEEEIYSTIDDIFINKKEKIDFNTFSDLIIRKERYELFIPLISFFYDNKPFNNEEINEFYMGYYNNRIICHNDERIYNLENVINLKEMETKEENENNNNYICNSIYKVNVNLKNQIISNKSFNKYISNKNNIYSKNEQNLHLGTFKNNFLKNNNNTIIETPNLTKEVYEKYILNSQGFSQMRRSIPLVINNSNILNSNKNNEMKKSKNLVDLNQTKLRFEINNSRKNKKKKKREGSVIYSFCQNIIKSSCMTFNNKNDTDTEDYEKDSLQKSLGVQMNTNLNNFNEIPWKKNNNITNKRIKYESYLYKVTKNGKIKKLYFKLNNQDLYFYKNEKSNTHKGMHNLSTYFLEIKSPINNDLNKFNISTNNNEVSDINKENLKYSVYKRVIDGKEYYCFLLINIKRQIHYYYTPDFEIYSKWIDALKIILKYKNIYEQYNFRKIIGKGKYCTVFYAYDTLNKRKAAIKKINKELLSLEDLSLIQTEVDTLKVCQHPYVVKLYEIIETYNEVYIILEYCELGNLYSYLKKTSFKLTEEEIVTYIHDISKAVYSMHNLGIIHRDLKLSNIALTNHNNKNEIRILDFGLSKILGPNQCCNEGYGTPGYAAPEVIYRYNYSFGADVWCIGVISFFLCEGNLPFDYIRSGRKEKDIIENTLLDEVNFSKKTILKYSKNAIKFIKDLMNKNVHKRPNIKEVLEHEWLQLYFKNEVKKRKINTYKNEFYENPEIEESCTFDENIENSKQIRTNYLLYTSINNK